MKASISPSSLAAVLAFTLVLLASCGGGSNGGSREMGTLSLALTDASNNDCQAVYMTIREVQVHTPCGEWEAAASPNYTYNLLNLVNGRLQQLGATDLPVGDYSEIRLLLGNTPDIRQNLRGHAHPYANYVIDSGGEAHELKVPSGYQTGIKMVYGFSIVADQEINLILELDASKSVFMAGGEQWILKPTIKVLNEKTCSVIEGDVVDEAGNPLEGVSVTVQVSNPDARNPRYRVVVEASALTNENGQFKLLTSPGTYNVVAYKNNYDSDWECAVAALSGQTQVGTFSLPFLEKTEMGRVSGTVTMTGGQSEQYVAISFRELGSCNDRREDMELKSTNMADQGTYNEGLPAGKYEVVFSNDNNTPPPSSVDIVGGETVHLNLNM